MSVGKAVNQAGFDPSRNSDQRIWETAGMFVAAISRRDSGNAVSRTTSRDMLKVHIS